MWLDAPTDVNGFPMKYSPRGIVTGFQLDFKNNCAVVLYSYMEAHENPNITDKSNPSTHDCISLRTAVNQQENHKVFFLKS